MAFCKPSTMGEIRGVQSRSAFARKIHPCGTRSVFKGITLEIVFKYWEENHVLKSISQYT